MNATYECPKCGNTEGLYRSADCRWNTTLREWVLSVDIEDETECTNCDFTGDISDFEIKCEGGYMRPVDVVYVTSEDNTKVLFCDFKAFASGFLVDVGPDLLSKVQYGTVLVPYAKGCSWESCELFGFIDAQLLGRADRDAWARQRRIRS